MTAQCARHTVTAIFATTYASCSHTLTVVTSAQPPVANAALTVCHRLGDEAFYKIEVSHIQYIENIAI